MDSRLLHPHQGFMEMQFPKLVYQAFREIVFFIAENIVALQIAGQWYL